MNLTREKAKEMLRHGAVHGKPLTKPQRGYFGAVAGDNSLKKAAKGAASMHQQAPVDLDKDGWDMVLVGDGGKDPSAEEYVMLPPGSEAIIAPKLSPKEKPSMDNAVKAVANTMLKAQYGAVSSGGGGGSSVSAVGYGSNVRTSPASGYMPSGYRNGVRQYVRIGNKTLGSGGVNTKPLSPVNMNIPPLDLSSPISGGPAVSAAPYDPGVDRVATMLASAILANPENPILTNDGFDDRPGNELVGAKNGAKKLIKAQYGGAPTVTDPYKSAGAIASAQRAADLYYSDLASRRATSGSSGSSSNQLSANTKYATDAQSAIANAQMAMQERLAALTNQYNLQRLALDRQLGQAQLALDRDNAAKQAAQLLMTRAGRQMIAPGGNVIPSMQPLIGRSIN